MKIQLEAAIAADPAVAHAYRTLSAHGEVHVVGGAIRDLLLGKPFKDVDLLVRLIPADTVQELLDQGPGVAMMHGEAFGVIRYRDPSGAEVEVALPRKDTSTGAGHKDFDVNRDPHLPIEEDLVRRDFTCNAIAWNAETGELIDPHGGVADIAAGVLRCVSDQAFPEDPLRLLRGLRAHARHGLIPDETTIGLMRTHATSLEHLAPNRIGEEWEELMKISDAHRGISLAIETGLLAQIAPAFADPERAELARLRARELNGDQSKISRLAATMSALDAEAPVAADKAREAMEAMKLSNDVTHRTCHLISHSAEPAILSDTEARRFLSRLGREHTEDFIAVRGAVSALADDEAVLLRGVITRGEPTRISDLAVSGADLIASGMKPGPQMGETLRMMLDVVLEDPARNRREDLLSLVA